MDEKTVEYRYKRPEPLKVTESRSAVHLVDNYKNEKYYQ